jgi:hypothetical protein
MQMRGEEDLKTKATSNLKKEEATEEVKGAMEENNYKYI